jgi:hypothetical protein
MKKWLLLTLTVFGTTLFLIGIFNFFMDSFWCFEHSHRYNSVQKGTNERQQKANYLYFTTKKYDTLLLGSSRTTYMNRHAFKNMDVYNFAARGMRPQEYITYIDFAINNCHQPIKTIILGTDFFGYLSYGLFMFNNAPGIVKTTQTTYYRWKLLFSFDATNNSIKNFRDYYHQRNIDRYDRDNVKSSFPHPTDFTGFDERIQSDTLGYAQAEYSSKPNPNFSTILKEIKTKYQTKKFFIYTTPVSRPLFLQLIKTGHYHDYENWLRDLVNIYSEVHHFMYINSVATNYRKYFADCNHAYSDTYTLIAHDISATDDPSIPKDFGMLLTKENIEEKLLELRILNGVQ